MKIDYKNVDLVAHSYVTDFYIMSTYIELSWVVASHFNKSNERKQIDKLNV